MKTVSTENKQLDRCTTSVFELLHAELAAPMALVCINRHIYVTTFIEDFFSVVFVYFLKSKKDTVSATQKFIADSAPYGRIRSLRCDNRCNNSSQIISRNFSVIIVFDMKLQHLIHSTKIGWRKGIGELFEMARSFRISTVMTSAVI